MSFVEKLQAQSGGKEIFYVWSKDGRGLDAWWYVKVAPAKHAAFERALDEGTDLAKWGEVLKSGYGLRSPDNIRAQMKEQHGFEHRES